MRKRSLILCTLAALAALAPNARSDKLLGIVEATSYRQLQEDFNSFCTHISNPMLNMAMLQLGNALGTPGLMGLDQEKPIRLALFLSDAGAVRTDTVLMLPVQAGGKAYLDALAINYNQLDDDGITKRFAAKRRLPTYAEMSMTLVGDVAVISPSKPLVDKVAGWLRDDPAQLAVRGIQGTLRARLQPETVLPIIATRLDELRGVAAAAVVDAPVEIVVQMLELFSKAVLTAEDQVNGLTLALQCNELGLSYYGRLDAKPDSPLAKSIGEMKAPSTKIRDLIDQNADFMYVSGELGAILNNFKGMLSNILKVSYTYQLAMFQKQPNFEANKKLVEELTEAGVALIEAYGDEMAMFFTTGGEDAVFESGKIAAVKDADTIKAKTTFLTKAMYEFMVDDKTWIDLETLPQRTVNGIAVDSYKIKLVDRPPQEAEIKPEPAQQDAPPADGGNEAAGDEADDEDDGEEDMEDEVFQIALRDAFAMYPWVTQNVSELAFADGYVFELYGKAGVIDKSLEALSNPPADSLTPRIKTLFPDIGNADEAVSFWAFKPLTMVRNFAPTMPEGFDVGMLEMLKQFPDDGKGTGGVALASGTTWMGALRFSVDQLEAFTKAVRLGMDTARRADIGRPEEPAMGEPIEVVIPEP